MKTKMILSMMLALATSTIYAEDHNETVDLKVVEFRAYSSDSAYVFVSSDLLKNGRKCTLVYKTESALAASALMLAYANDSTFYLEFSGTPACGWGQLIQSVRLK